MFTFQKNVEPEILKDSFLDLKKSGNYYGIITQEIKKKLSLIFLLLYCNVRQTANYNIFINSIS